MKQACIFLLLVLATMSLFAMDFGNCLSFDGTNDYVQLPDQADFSYTDNMTVECWVYPTTWNRDWQAIVTKGDDSWRLHRDNNTDHVRFEAGGVWVSSTSEITPYVWTHIAGVKEGTELRLYVNGILEASATGANNTTTGYHTVCIGENSEQQGRHFYGRMDEVRLWSIARTQEEIQSHIHSFLSGGEPGLTAYYRFDSSSGSILYDETGNHDGTLVNMDNSDWESSTLGFMGCIYLDGVDDYVELPDESAFDYTSEMTLECWLRVDEFTTPWQAIITKGSAWRLNRSDISDLISFDRSAPNQSFCFNTNINDNQWHHIAVTFHATETETNFYFYVDGELDRHILTGLPLSTNDFPVAIGENLAETGRNFKGWIDEIRLWSVERSPQEIQRNYLTTLSGDEPGLTAYYKCDYTYTNLYDETGNHHGTLMNMSSTSWQSHNLYTIFDEAGSALDFDGIDQQVNLGSNSGITGSSSRTVECWANIRDFTEGATILQAGTAASSSSGFSLQTSDTDNWLQFATGGSFGTILEVEAPGCGQSWHHYALTYDGTTLYLYYDGELILESVRYMNTQPGDMFLGKAPDFPNYFDGMIDEVRFWDIARTQEEIIETMNQTLHGYESGLIHYWQFENVYNGQVNDYIEPVTGTMINMDDTDVVPSGAFSLDMQTMTVGDGFSGWLDFDQVGLDVNVLSHTGEATWVALRHQNAFDPTPDVTIDYYDQQYWRLYSIGPDSFDMNMVFEVSQDIAPSDPLAPSLTRLLRYQGSGSWLDDPGASDIDRENHQITFTGVDSDGTFVIGRDYNLAVTSLSPADESSFLAGDSFVIEFDRQPFPGAGSIRIMDADAETEIEAFAASAVTIDGTQVSFTPTAVYDYGQAIYITIDPDAFYNSDGDYFGGISDDEFWNLAYWDAGLFTELSDVFPAGDGLTVCALCDWDNDGDLDVALSNNDPQQVDLFRNDGAMSFVLAASFAAAVPVRRIEFGDLDGDGYEDVAVSSAELYPLTYLYRNEGNTAFSLMTQLNGFWPAFGDCDNDGDLDVLLQYGEYASIERNDGNWVFTDIGTSIHIPHGSYKKSGSWCDYDSDGHLDIGYPAGPIYDYNTLLFRSDPQSPGTFIAEGSPLSRFNGTIRYVDANNDGNTDLFHSGGNQVSFFQSELFYNDGTGFVDQNICPKRDSATPRGVFSGTSAWGDIDNNGFSDMMIQRQILTSNEPPYSSIYENTLFLNRNGALHNVHHPFSDLTSSSLYQTAVYETCAVGDLDGDGDLDILLIPFGQDRYIYRNDMGTTNTPPVAPASLDVTFDEESGWFTASWDMGSDAETSAPGLSYNLDFQALRGDGEMIRKISPADSVTGFIRRPEMGNVGQVQAWSGDISDLTDEVFPIQSVDLTLDVWVQAVDPGFVGSDRAHAQVWVPTSGDLVINCEDVMLPESILYWQISNTGQLEGWQLQVAEDSGFTTPVIDQYLPYSPARATTRGDLRSKTDSQRLMQYYGAAMNELTGWDSLTSSQNYYLRIKPVYTDYPSRYQTQEITFQWAPANQPPLAPTAGFNPTGDCAVDTLMPMLNWGNGSDPDDPADSLFYVVILADTLDFDDPDFTPDFSGATGMGQTFITVTPALTPGLRYEWAVVAVDPDSLVSLMSDVQSFITLMPPQNVTLARNGDDVVLSWDSFPLAGRSIVYTVYSADNPEAPFPEAWSVEAVQLSTPTWTDTAPDAQRKFYRVTAGSEAPASRENPVGRRNTIRQ